MPAMNLPRVIQQYFARHHLYLHPLAMDALLTRCKLLIASLSNANRNDPTSILQDFCQKITTILKQNISARSLITREDMENVLTELVHSTTEPQTSLSTPRATSAPSLISGFHFSKVIDAFSHPRFEYDSIRRIFHSAELLSMHGTAQDKTAMYRARFRMLRQRLLRHPSFAPPANRFAAARAAHVPIVSIDSLLGTSGKKCIFGMLTRITDDGLYIEDDHRYIRIDVSAALLTMGCFTDHSFVIAEGELVDEVFVVHTMAFPPTETRETSLLTFSNLDLCAHFAQQNTSIPSYVLKSIAHEGHTFTEQCAHELNARPTDMIIVLSEVHLNSPKVTERLRKIFSVFAEMATPPPAFILMGSFYTTTPVPSASSTVTSEEYQATLSAPFSAFADLIASFPSIARSSRFILVPSEKDPGFNNCLPRPGLPSVLLSRLREKVQNIEFPSNPCRFMYYSREIVIFRDNLVHTLRRNCLLKPNESENSELVEHVVRTIMDQSHLSPIPMSTRPIIWNYDHALQLYPLPSVVMLGDSVQSYEFSYEHCPAINVGSFAADGSFVVYYPSTNKVEMSSCP